MTEEFKVEFAEGFKPAITVGGNGNWYIDGKDSGTPANVINGDVMYTVPVDATLTQAGYAADAAVTGDSIRELKEDLGNIATKECDSSQIFDKEKCKVIDANFGKKLSASDLTKTVIILCEPNTTYTISLPTNSYNRFIIADIDSEPTIGMDINTIWQYGLDHKTVLNGRDYVQGTTGKNAKYILVYYHNSNYDTVDESIIRCELLVTKGTDKIPYANYKLNYYINQNTISYLDDRYSFKGQGGDGGGVTYSSTTSVHLGIEVLNVNGTFDDDSGWNGNNSNGYTHTSVDVSKDLVFKISTDEDSVYLLEFDTTYTSGEFISVGIGSLYKNLAYNGLSHIEMPLLSDGGYLTITPMKDVAFTISNLSLKKIQTTGEEKTLETISVLTDNHTNNYGYRNILLGNNSANKAVGSTRTIAVGANALGNLLGGHRNIALGGYALSQMYGGEENTAIGADAMIFVKGGEENIAIGTASLAYGNSIKSNVAIGRSAMQGSADSTAQNNVAIGKNAGRACYGHNNTYVGAWSGQTNIIGNSNVGIGYWAYGQRSGDNNVHIGTYASYEDGCSDVIAIGNRAKATKSGQTVIGGKNTTETILKGDLIVQATDGTKKQIVFNTDGTCSWTTVTD